MDKKYIVMHEDSISNRPAGICRPCSAERACELFRQKVFDLIISGALECGAIDYKSDFDKFCSDIWALSDEDIYSCDGFDLYLDTKEYTAHFDYGREYEDYRVTEA